MLTRHWGSFTSVIITYTDSPVPDNRRELLSPTVVLSMVIKRNSCPCVESNPGTRKWIIAAHERINQYSTAMFVIQINKTVYFSQTAVALTCTSSCAPHMGHGTNHARVCTNSRSQFTVQGKWTSATTSCYTVFGYISKRMVKQTLWFWNYQNLFVQFQL
jgi:hypothetical protein